MLVDKIQYTTIKEPLTFEIEKIKGSRFIGHIFKVDSRNHVEEHLETIRKKYYDARHNCFAYLIDDKNQNDFRYSDDGEPSGTGGKPIYNFLEGSGIINCLIVVTRYFGGTKLGTGGLIKAYGEAAKAVLDRALKEVVEIKDLLLFSYDYDYTNLVMSILNEYEAKKITETYGDSATLTIELNKAYTVSFLKEIKERSNGRIDEVKILEALN